MSASPQDVWLFQVVRVRAWTAERVMAGLSAVILAVVVGGVYYAMWRQVFANRGPNRNFAGWGGQAYSNMLKVVDVVTCIDLPERGTGLISFHCLARPEPGG